jgi:hypothetical protein
MTFYTNMVFSGVRSLKGNTCAQVFTNGSFIQVIPMVMKAQAGEALDTFHQDIGISDQLVFDGALEQTGPKTDFMKSVRRNHIHWRVMEPYSHWQNQAEGAIHEVR